MENTLAKLRNAKVFSKLDANAGFWQCKLSESSKLFTTFITPVGRYCYNRLPFGITSGPEFFQEKIYGLLKGISGVECLMDDIIVYGENQEEHDKNLETVLSCLLKAGLTLNKEKCVFSQDQINFVGHRVGKDGITADPDKVEALLNMKEPTNVSEIRRFLEWLTS